MVESIDEIKENLTDSNGEIINVKEALTNSNGEIVSLQESLPFKLAIDPETGDYGYIKAGADSVTPFNSKIKVSEELLELLGKTTYNELEFFYKILYLYSDEIFSNEEIYNTFIGKYVMIRTAYGTDEIINPDFRSGMPWIIIGVNHENSFKTFDIIQYYSMSASYREYGYNENPPNPSWKMSNSRTYGITMLNKSYNLKSHAILRNIKQYTYLDNVPNLVETEDYICIPSLRELGFTREMFNKYIFLNNTNYIFLETDGIDKEGEPYPYFNNDDITSHSKLAGRYEYMNYIIFTRTSSLHLLSTYTYKYTLFTINNGNGRIGINTPGYNSNYRSKYVVRVGCKEYNYNKEEIINYLNSKNIFEENEFIENILNKYKFIICLKENEDLQNLILGKKVRLPNADYNNNQNTWTIIDVNHENDSGTFDLLSDYPPVNSQYLLTAFGDSSSNTSVNYGGITLHNNFNRTFSKFSQDILDRIPYRYFDCKLWNQQNDFVPFISDKRFVPLSLSEIMEKSIDSIEDGIPYKYLIDNPDVLKTYNGSFWLRTPKNIDYVYRYNTNGNIDYISKTNTSYARMVIRMT